MHLQHPRGGHSLPQLKGSRSSPMSSPFLPVTELTSMEPLRCKIKWACQSEPLWSPRPSPGFESGPKLPGNAQCQAGCQCGDKSQKYLCWLFKEALFFFFSLLFSFSLAPNRIIFWFWKASAGMQRTEWWLRRRWPSHLLCIVEYIFHMFLGETSNKGHQVLEIEQKR